MCLITYLIKLQLKYHIRERENGKRGIVIAIGKFEELEVCRKGKEFNKEGKGVFTYILTLYLSFFLRKSYKLRPPRRSLV